MKALLMHRVEDFDLQRGLPLNEPILTNDLELDTLLGAMAAGDRFLYEVARAAVFSGLRSDVDTVLYRQDILKDCLANPQLVRRLYALTVEATDSTKRLWWDLSSQYPDSVLYGAVSLLDSLREMLRRLRQIAEEAGSRFQSEGFTALFALLQLELGDDYLSTIEQFLSELKFRNGTLLRAELGEDNDGINYTLIRPPKKIRVGSNASGPRRRPVTLSIWIPGMKLGRGLSLA